MPTFNTVLTSKFGNGGSLGVESAAFKEKSMVFFHHWALLALVIGSQDCISTSWDQVVSIVGRDSIINSFNFGFLIQSPNRSTVAFASSLTISTTPFGAVTVVDSTSSKEPCRLSNFSRWCWDENRIKWLSNCDMMNWCTVLQSFHLCTRTRAGN